MWLSRSSKTDWTWLVQQIDPKILGKIKKCLALASSDNANEAATALRQAHALMSLHGVSVEHITMAEIGEGAAKSRTMSRSKPAQWEGALASVVGLAFGCQLMFSRAPKKTAKRTASRQLNDAKFIFVGITSQAQVAAYTFDVLARKCKKARAEWIAKHLEGISEMSGGKRVVTGMGDQFASGWVYKISQLVQEFAQPKNVEAAIAQFISHRATCVPDSESLLREPATQNERLRAIALASGIRAAEGESIHRPVNGVSENLRLSLSPEAL